MLQAQFGRTAQASQSPGAGSNSLVMGPTQTNGVAFHSDVSSYQSGGNPCFGTVFTGAATGGNHVLVGTLGDPAALQAMQFAPAPNASVNIGKYVYRML